MPDNEKKDNSKSLCIRFNLSKSGDKEVWDILHNLDRKKWKSYSRAVITAVKDFFDRLSKLECDPYFETREREEKFAADIISAVERSMDKEIPKYLSVCIGEILRQYSSVNGSVPAPAAAAVSDKNENTAPVKSADNDTADFSEVDLDFMGE